LQFNETPVHLEEVTNTDGVQLFRQAFGAFNGSAQKLAMYYQRLEERVRALDVELESRNRALKESLREKEEVKNYLRNILESLTTGVIVLDLKGDITTFNAAAENITDLQAAEVKGEKFDNVFGSDFFRNTELDFKCLREMRENTRIETEINRDDRSVFHLDLSVSQVKDRKGSNLGIVLTLQDITRVKELEDQANRADRLAAMGEMAAKIAHEIRNPLGSIELFASVLKKELQDSGEYSALAGHISSGVNSINNIISNILLFIRPQQEPDFKIIDIRDPLEDSLFFSTHLTKSDDGIEVSSHYSPEPLTIRADPELMKRVFLNLILNAIQAMPDGGRLAIDVKEINEQCKTAGHYVSSRPILMRPLKRSSRRAVPHQSGSVEIRFADTGTGISKAQISRIFHPFFTTKKRGTGLGLAIVHNIIKDHGGAINIDSSEGEGTVCVVRLPLHSNGEDRNAGTVNIGC